MIQKLKNKFIMRRQENHDARAAVELSRLNLPYLPWPGSAIAPSSLCTILNEIQINNRKTIVEFGSGISTLYIAKVLERTGGHIVSIENDSGWSAIIKEWIDTAGLSNQVTLVDAPLAPCSISDHNLEWYQEDTVVSALSDLTIDCVLVDGPPAYEKGKELARYPALPMTYKKLSDNCVVFLDDIHRVGEKEVIKKWATYSGIKFNQHLRSDSLARGVRGSAFYSAI